MIATAIDLFAGWGGGTCGAEMAGVRVVYAANHDPVCVRAHAANHPSTKHECQDLRQANFARLPSYDLLIGAPACQAHSRASQPRRREYHDVMRSTAWAIVECAEVTRPRALIVENVLQFRRWQLYPLWRAALETLGYTLSELDVCAARHGVPQRRRRLFVVGTLNGALIDLPSSSVELPFGPHIAWTDGDWRLVRRASRAVRERIAQAQANHGPRALSQHVTGHLGVSLEEPIRTITTQDQWIVVDGDRYRPLTIRENQRAMGFPDAYAWPSNIGRRAVITGLGNAICPPVMKDIVTALKEAA